MLFKDWRQLSTESVGLDFDPGYVHYVHSRAWAFKGWLGGTHSWLVFWADNSWLSIELTTKETLGYQEASKIYYIRNVDPESHSPVISNRTADGRWFGSGPVIVDRCANTYRLGDFIKVCEQYPYSKFNLLNQNCNTFTSYVKYRLGLDLKRPLRSWGAKNWNNHVRVYATQSL